MFDHLSSWPRVHLSVEPKKLSFSHSLNLFTLPSYTFANYLLVVALSIHVLIVSLAVSAVNVSYLDSSLAYYPLSPSSHLIVSLSLFLFHLLLSCFTLYL